jgi:hypothetical protein
LQAWAVGAKVYWDDSAKVATITATDNTLIGVAVQAVGDGADETIGRVWLNGSFGRATASGSCGHSTRGRRKLRFLLQGSSSSKPFVLAAQPPHRAIDDGRVEQGNEQLDDPLS